MTKRIVHELNFEKDGAHVALVTKGANQQEVLLMKSKAELEKSNEVQITTSMQTFLTTFFYMWEDEARELAELLGYEPQDWSYEIIGDETNVTIMKSLKEGDKVSKELYEKIEKMGSDFTKLLKGKTMDKKKKVEDTELQKTIDDAVKAALAKNATETADLQKSIDDRDAEIVDLKKAEDVRIKGEFVELCKGYSFVEDADALSDTLFLCKGIKGFDLILTTMEKARTAMKEALTGEVGTDQEKALKKEEKEVPANLTKTTELIKARYSTTKEND